MIYWLKRIGYGLLGVATLVAAVWLAWFFGKKNAIDQAKAQAEIDRAKLELKKLEDQHEKLGIAAREAAHQRQAYLAAIADATARLDKQEAGL